DRKINKKTQIQSRDYDKVVLYSRKRELKTGESMKICEICSTLASTVQYNLTEESTDEESQEEAPK
ncbi:12376_t:CDS:1, partial [Racocetra persica]